MRRTRRDRLRARGGLVPEARAPVTGRGGAPGGDQPPAGAGDDDRPASARGGRFEMTVGAFLALQRSGALRQGPRAELVDGTVEAGTALDPSEAAAFVNLHRALAAAGLRDRGVEVLSWAALRLGAIDLVRAPLVVVPGPAYEDGPGGGAGRARRTRDVGAGIGGSFDPAGTFLVVETVRAAGPQHARLAGYAAAGANEVWLLDVKRGWVESFRSPWRREYRSRTLWYPGESVPITALGDVAVEALAPP